MKTLRIKVKPNSKNQNFVEAADGSVTVRLKSLSTDGKANQELIKLIAKQSNVSKSKITIKSGLSSRNKLVEVSS